MRAISNRIRRLENILTPPQVQDERESLVEVMERRLRRRHLEAADLPFVEEPRRPSTPYGRNVSLADILSGRYHDKAPPP
jgi:hypothetical protein